MKMARWTAVCVIPAMCLVSMGTACQSRDEAAPLARIRAKAAETRDELIEIRRQIHMNPEVSGQEAETAKTVAAYLRGLGLDVETGVGGHGVVGVLRGLKPGPVVAYRADMDAVPSPIVGDQPYRSRIPGVKHVCGHDAHVAVGLGIAGVLAAIRDDIPGTVKFIFQPAEENVQGARAMIAEGVLENPSPEAIFAVHTIPIPVGTIACPAGVGLSGWLPFRLTLSEAGDLEGLAELVAGALDEISTVELSWTPDAFTTLVDDLLVEGGPYEEFVYVSLTGDSTGEDGSSRVIEGRIRADGEESYTRARQQLEAAAKEIAQGRGRIEVTFAEEEKFPDMHSDPTLVRAAIEPIEAAIGEGNALPMHASAPFFGEDFALFQQRIPGAMFFLGVANEEKGITAFNHFPDYDIDEAAIEVGTVAMANVLVNYLQTHAALPESSRDDR